MKSQFKFDEEVLYIKKSISRIIGVIMLIVSIVFIMFALNHPEKSFPCPFSKMNGNTNRNL